MSQRIARTFETLAAQRRTALVAYLTAGDPDFELSREMLIAACHAGVDVLELGVPFSDPTSDGPAIQAAAQRALHHGASVARSLELVRAVRATCETPIVLFTYFNPLLRYGLGRLCADATANGLPLIRLLAPTTPTERMRHIAEGAGGFLYLITRTGVTGGGTLDAGEIGRHATRLRALTPLPICLGFGISSPEDARALAPLADGVVVGSAFVKRAAERAAHGDAPAAVAALAASFRRALDA